MRQLRSLLPILLVLATALPWLPPASAAQAPDAPPPVSPDAQPQEQPEESRAGPRAPAELPLRIVPLRRNLRFTVRPTILGLIPPDSAEDYGEGLIRVTAVAGSSISLHYEIKEEVEKERGGEQVFELQEAPVEMRTEFLTRIRRGDMQVPDFSQGARVACPLFFGEGDYRAEGYGLLWLPPGLLGELKDAGGCDWDLDCTSNTAPEVAKQLEDLKAAYRRGAGLPDDARPRLELVEGAGRYIVPVNGEMCQLEALRCRDSYGMAEYWFLNDPANPLLLKMSFIASPEASPEREGIARQLLAGTGFAVTSINY